MPTGVDVFGMEGTIYSATQKSGSPYRNAQIEEALFQMSGNATTLPLMPNSELATQNRGMECVRAHAGKLERMRRFNKAELAKSSSICD